MTFNIIHTYNAYIFPSLIKINEAHGRKTTTNCVLIEQTMIILICWLDKNTNLGDLRWITLVFSADVWFILRATYVAFKKSSENEPWKQAASSNKPLFITSKRKQRRSKRISFLCKRRVPNFVNYATILICVIYANRPICEHFCIPLLYPSSVWNSDSRLQFSVSSADIFVTVATL